MPAIRRQALAVLALTAAVSCGRHTVDDDESVWAFSSPMVTTDSAGNEVWMATPVIEDAPEPVRVAFLIHLMPPGRLAKAGERVRGALVRAEPRMQPLVALSLMEVFASNDSGAGSGAGGDSVPLTAVARQNDGAFWTANVQLENGGEFVLALDKTGRRGELRRATARGDQRVFLALMALAAPKGP
jgi:hypothetical protein